MVIMPKIFDISAILAPVLVSPPYAAGNTIVFNPNGVATAPIKAIIIFLSTLRAIKISAAIAGITISLKREAT